MRMQSPNRRNAFTLIELLIVAIILALLAVTIIPHLTATPDGAKMNDLKLGLTTLRSQLEMYREQHLGVSPPATDNASFLAQMSSKTNQDTTLNPAHGLCGPYIDEELPTNPFNDGSTIAIVNGVSDPTGPTGSSDGWQYNPTTGHFFPNNAEYFQQ
jgi:general secretion pathway protein G